MQCFYFVLIMFNVSMTGLIFLDLFRPIINNMHTCIQYIRHLRHKNTMLVYIKYQDAAVSGVLILMWL